jgi:hypothetical protein
MVDDKDPFHFVVCSECSYIHKFSAGVFIKQSVTFKCAEDLTPFSLKTRITIADKEYRFVGRTKMEMGTAYLNHWHLAELSSGAFASLFEYFGTYFLGKEEKLEITSKVFSGKHPGSLIVLNETYGETYITAMHKVDAFKYEGRVPGIFDSTQKHFYIETNDGEGECGFFLLNAAKEIVAHLGYEYTYDEFKLIDQRQFHDWKSSSI